MQYPAWQNAAILQEIAINRAIKALLQGKKRVLLTLATGLANIHFIPDNLEAMEYTLEQDVSTGVRRCFILLTGTSLLMTRRIRHSRPW